MKIFRKKGFRLITVMLAIAAMCTITVSAASTAKATNNVRFRTAVVNKLSLSGGTKAQVVRNGETLDAFEGMRLFTGDTVRTVGDAKLYILVDQNKIIRLSGDTEVMLENTLLGTKVRMKLVSGSMFFNVVEKLPEDESLQFIYGNITISVRGTSASLQGQNGVFAVAVTDGTVQAAETLPDGREVSMPIEAGTKFENAAGDSMKGVQSLTKTSAFVLSELPSDVVEEMKNDENLKVRIVGSVPVSNGPSGPVYTTPDKVDLNFDCSMGGNTMEPSKEIQEKAEEVQEKTLSSPAETVKKFEVNSQEVETENNEEDSVSPVYIPNELRTICKNCSGEFTAKEYSAHLCACGVHTVCQEEYDSHDVLECGAHYACCVEEDSLYMHQLIPDTDETMCQNPDKWVYCKNCGQYFLKEEYAAADHALAPCGKHYVCEEGYDPEEHRMNNRCSHYKCELQAFHGNVGKGCGSDAECINITDWREHLKVEYYLFGIHVGSKNICQMLLEDLNLAAADCPLCGERVSVSELRSGATHLHYDGKNRCITCNGVRQSTEAFGELFTDRGFTSEDLEEILEYLDIAPDEEE